MAGNEKAGDVAADSVGSTKCPKCGHIVDVSRAAAFSTVRCPQCKTAFTAPGKLGQFVLLHLLGKGEMGATYKAHDKILGRQVAIKVMKKSLGKDPKRVESFLAEGRALASLDHPNAVRIFSLGQEKNQPYIVMELLAGKALDKKYSLDKAMDETLALNITIQIALALKAASKIKLIHGDVKPANIMIDEKGGAKLVDFGLARIGDRHVAEGAAFGTPYYVAPEQVLKESIDHRTDVYSLGATLFHILACMPPFPGKTLKEVLAARLEKPAPNLLKIRPSLHRETAAVVARMLQREPDDRYGDYGELLKDLRHAHAVVTGKAKAAPAPVVVKRRPAKVQPRPVKARPRRARSKRGLGIAIGAVGLIMVAAVGGVVFYLWSTETGPDPVFPPPGGVITDPADTTTPDTRKTLENVSWQNQDIGKPSSRGKWAYNDTTGMHTIEGGGTDIWDEADQFHYVCTSFSGNGEIVARVASIENTHDWAKAGVMIRETLAANSKHAAIVVTPGFTPGSTPGISFQRRTTTGDKSYGTTTPGFAAPHWVKLVRSGNTFTGYRSPNGTDWTQQDSIAISMPRDVYIGMVVTSHDVKTLCTAKFDNVSITTLTVGGAKKR